MCNTNGLTFIGMLLTMAIAIFLGLFAMRIIPVYIQHYNVVQALNGLHSLPQEATVSDDSSSNEISLKKSLQKQFEIDNINDITDNNIVITPHSSNQYTVTIKYQVTRPLIGNIDLLFNFENSTEVTLGSQ